MSKQLLQRFEVHSGDNQARGGKSVQQVVKPLLLIPHQEASHHTPDFESWRAPSEKLRKANKTLGIHGFSPDEMSDSFS